ncbi:amino acid transporter [Aspergillus steynii IBT 23096]|uniref:Amino acid transporter n=1 Tax=Aspergillus steynii IBT 23096 TaxID=1392250 RepID=A0A2I2GCY4_9EURO|nr:amino acid transporter [Aspergillus steynii IBT 23096]PLB50744.1 amino acid transporter [Aspergillus steynii IBT 23096]
MQPSDSSQNELPTTFSVWSGISMGWNTINSFRGLSFMLFIGLAAGGLPGLLYGFIGCSVGVMSLTLVLAECSSRFATAGGAYHFATFLIPPKYRRGSAYVLGWFNYLGWTLTHASCCAVVSTLILALVNLCAPDYDVSVRWQLFQVYIGVATYAWLFNIFGLRWIPALELLGTWATVLGFLTFTVVLLAVALKASARSVLVDVNNDTGYSSSSLAVFLGLYNSMATLMAVDGPTHLAEELAQPKRVMPRMLIITVSSQCVVGIVWILVLGFSLVDLQSALDTATGVPITELVQQATGSTAAAIVFCLALLIHCGTSAVASATTSSRQGYAFARDGGMFCNHKLAEISPRFQLPLWSIHLPYGITAVVGIVYLFSHTAFNALVGGQSAFMTVSCGCPALILLLTRRRTLPPSDHGHGQWTLGPWADATYTVAVGYAVLVIAVVFIPQSHPVTSTSMNYTVLIVGAFLIVMGITWILEGRRTFHPPAKDPQREVLQGEVVLEELGMGGEGDGKGKGMRVDEEKM